MDNRILRLDVRDHALAAAAAELRVAVASEARTPATELRGRLTGPRCPYAATVEVAYPLRPLPGPPEAPGALAARVAVPEASLWDPQSPFLYTLTVELWQDGRRCDQAAMSRGLRSLALRPDGLRVNGRALALRGRAVTACDDAEALALRRAGCNLLLAPLTASPLPRGERGRGEGAAPLWERADRLGFFILGRPADAADARLLDELSSHPSHLGLLLDGTAWPPRMPDAPAGRVGVALDGPPPGALPEGVHFLACPAGRAADLAPLGLPLLLLGPGPDAPGAFGRVE
jgi:hypothetical protein